MSIISVDNSRSLEGKIVVNGSKNSVLPILSAVLLSESPVTLRNVPKIMDVMCMFGLLTDIGVKINFIDSKESVGHSVFIDSVNIDSFVLYSDIVKKIRSSCLILGPLLAKFGKAKIGFPGGCAIGDRPINMHLSSLSSMGANINIKGGFIEAYVDGKLKGADIKFSTVSVGATENVMMAATLANGVTTISNAAKEPEVVDLANFLVNMGAKIYGIGTRKLIIEGVDALIGCDYTIMPDRLEAGTYILSSIITGGKIEILGVNFSHIRCMLKQLRDIGANLSETESGLFVSRADDNIRSTSIDTSPYPGFPTDMQSQFAAVLSVADGVSEIRENIFNNRFMYVSELNKMGADIKISDNNSIIITGVKDLKGSVVKSTDLRSAAALLIAGLRAKGSTKIVDSFHLLRGYEAIDKKLSACGAFVSFDYLEDSFLK